MRTRSIGSLEVAERRARLQQLRPARGRGGDRAPSWMPRSRRASPSSTRPTSTARPVRDVPGPHPRGPARPGGDRHEVRDAARRRGRGRGARRRTSDRPSRRASGGSRTDRIDLYQLHEPRPETPIADTLGALDDSSVTGRCERSDARTSRRDSSGRRAMARGRRAVRGVQNELSLLERADLTTALPEAERLGHGLPALLPAGQRHPHREVPARRARGPRVSAGRWYDEAERAEALGPR